MFVYDGTEFVPSSEADISFANQQQQQQQLQQQQQQQQQQHFASEALQEELEFWRKNGFLKKKTEQHQDQEKGEEGKVDYFPEDFEPELLKDLGLDMPTNVRVKRIRREERAEVEASESEGEEEDTAAALDSAAEGRSHPYAFEKPGVKQEEDSKVADSNSDKYVRKKCPQHREEIVFTQNIGHHHHHQWSRRVSRQTLARRSSPAIWSMRR